jgi:hypothetical protein
LKLKTLNFPLGKPKWSRPGHTIERNLEASGKEKINLESFIIQTICLKQVFFLCQINKLPSEPLTDHFEEVLLPKLLDF